jgi:hypothetical protein
LRRDVLLSPVSFYKLPLQCHPTGYWMLDDIMHYQNANSNSRRIFANFGNMIRFEFKFAKAYTTFYVGIRIRIRRIVPSFSKFEFAEYSRIRIRIRIGRIFPTPGQYIVLDGIPLFNVDCHRLHSGGVQRGFSLERVNSPLSLDTSLRCQYVILTYCPLTL